MTGCLFDFYQFDIPYQNSISWNNIPKAAWAKSQLPTLKE